MSTDIQDDEIDLAELFATLWAGKHIIGAFCAATILAMISPQLPPCRPV